MERDGVRLAVEDVGDGPPVVLLHGLTATRRYVVMGSKALGRAGHRTIAYDARGHGRSTPAPSRDAYGYDALAADLMAVLDATGAPRAVLAGVSMGAHTILAFALAHPDRVAALAVITPAFLPDRADEPDVLARWDALADGLREHGIDGFIDAYAAGSASRPPSEAQVAFQRQVLAQHEHPDAVADALHAVPRSHPFAALEELERIAAPAVVVASNDGADPGHPFAVGEAYAARIPAAQLVTEEPGSSPLAWQGAQLSRALAELAERAGPAPSAGA